MGRLCDAGQFQHLQLGIAVGVADNELHQESVELSLGERIGSLVLDRVLCGQHPESLRQDERLVANSDLAFLHGFQQGALDFGRGAVDLVGEQDAGDDGTGADVECPRGRPVDLGTGQVGRQEIGSELDAPKRQIQGLCERPDGTCLGQTGNAFDEDMAAGEQGDDQTIQEGPLTDDQVLEPLDQAL